LQKFILNPALGKGYGELLIKKIPTIRGQLIYKEGDIADKVFMVSKGEYELSRKLHRDISLAATEVIDRFGGRKPVPPGYLGHKSPKNALASKFTEITDVSMPEHFPLTIFGPGSFVGEEDVVFRDYYSCSFKTLSLKGMIYQV
jgi:CRP-like cAMP-binding protein